MVRDIIRWVKSKISQYSGILIVLFSLQAVGCDKILGSGKVMDQCQVCDGDGSTCYLQEGQIEVEHLKKGEISLEESQRTISQATVISDLVSQHLT